MKFFIVFVFLFFTFIQIFSQSEMIEIVSNNQSNFKIIISSSASNWDSLAADELQKYIREISNIELPIADDSSPETQHEIILGRNKHTENIDLSVLRDDGFIIKTVNEKIYLIGIGEKGTLNALYTFLEKYLNCRKYSSSVAIIPKQNSITIPQINLVENPAFAYRSIHYYETTNDEYCNWHKLVDSHDKKIWGMFVHTFHTLLSPDKYFENHPEYFAFRNGIRVPEQPCLTNPDVLRIITEDLRERIKANPEATIWSVSQNDNYSNCQCDNCKMIDEREGSPSGSLVEFVNKVAREFPDKIISTLAYQYSRKAPKTIKPEKNVNIMLCTIESFRTYPLADDTSNNAFVKDLIDWSELTKNIFLWDYVVQFTNYVSPFPNFQVLQPNIQLFDKYNVSMMFQQGAGKNNASEFGELRTYLIAKLLWNPEVNIDSLMNDFLQGYYGNAGKHILDYIDLMKDELIKSGANLWIYADPIESKQNYLAPNLMGKYNAIFDKAELSVSSEPEYLNRVKIARLPLTYAMLEHAKVINEGEKGLVIKKDERNYEPNPEIINLLDNFLTLTSNVKNVFVNEKSLSAEKYVERYKTMLSKTMKNPLGLNQQVQFLTTPNWKYPANGEKTLTDGIRGDEDHHYNWLGFEGNDMEVVIDLQEKQEIKKVSADFLQTVFSWIFLPEQVEVSISNNGKDFTVVSSIRNSTPVTKEELESPIFAFIKNFSCEFEPVETQYVKVKSDNMKICPRWHPGYPFKAWIFTDEIVVE